MNTFENSSTGRLDLKKQHRLTGLSLKSIIQDSPRESIQGKMSCFASEKVSSDNDFGTLQIENRNNDLHRVVMSPIDPYYTSRKSSSNFEVITNSDNVKKIDDEIQHINKKAKEIELENAKRRLEEASRARDERYEMNRVERTRYNVKKESPSVDFIESVRKKAEGINMAISRGEDPQRIVDPLLHAHAVPYVIGSEAIPDYDKLPHEQQEQIRNKFWTKIDILLEKNPIQRSKLPSSNASLQTLHKFYNDEIKRIKVKTGLGRWKIGLSLVILVFEGCMNRWSPFDMTGFGEFQMQQFSEQDQILVELGEKYISTGAAAADPESKLIWAILFNTIIFCAIKTLSSMTTINISSVMKMISELIGTKFGISNVENSKQKDEFEPEDAPEESGDVKIGGMLSSLGSLMGIDVNGVDTATKLGTFFTKKVRETTDAKTPSKKNEVPKKKKISVNV